MAWLGKQMWYTAQYQWWWWGDLYPIICQCNRYLQIRCVKETSIDSSCGNSWFNPKFDQLLESSRWDDSNRWSNRIWWRNKHYRDINTHLIWSPGAWSRTKCQRSCSSVKPYSVDSQLIWFLETFQMSGHTVWFGEVIELLLMRHV